MKVLEITEKTQFNTVALLDHIKRNNISSDTNVYRFIFPSDCRQLVRIEKKKGTLISKLFISSSAFPEYYCFSSN